MTTSTKPPRPPFTLPKPWALTDQQIAEQARPKFCDPSWMLQNINPKKKVAQINHWDIPSPSTPVHTKDDSEFLCSYSWKQTPTATIYVPGTPSKWTPPSLPTQLAPDNGLHYVDQHLERVPVYPFEPIFQSLAVMNPSIRFNDVDIVINRNTIQKLLLFASHKRTYGAFHVNLDMVGNTLFIDRQDRYAKTNTQSGYGRNFEADFTTDDPDLVDAEGHHRVIRYDLGRLNVVLRMEADGYIAPDAPLEADGATTESITPPHPSSTRSDTPFEDQFSDLCLTAKPTHTPTIPIPHTLATTVIAAGTPTPHPHSLELKSSVSKTLAREQIWFGRVPHLVFAKHKNGLVKALDESRWDENDFEDWAEKHQWQLRRLVWLLEELREVAVRKAGGHAVLVAVEKGAPLQIFEAKTAKGALPREIVERFWGRGV